MKKIVFVLIILFPIICTGQNKEKMDMLQNWMTSEYFKIDGDNIVVSQVINDIQGTKDEIYVKVKSFFARAYNNANSVIQTDDKESGTIIGKGFFKNFYSCGWMGIGKIFWDSYHVLRVDMKDNRIRVICSANKIEYRIWDGLNNKETPNSYEIVGYAPITDKRKFDKGKQTDAFIALVERMNDTISLLEKSVKEGIVSGENENW
jgi:hypothetical protein